MLKNCGNVAIRKIKDGISRKIYEEKHSNTALEEGKRRDCLGVERKSPNNNNYLEFFQDNRISGLINTNI